VMGGAVVVLSCDFRQTLPVIPKGTPADELKACLKNSYLWPNVIKLKLTTNMRTHVQGDQSSGQFSQKILQVGEGHIPEDLSGSIVLQIGTQITSVEELRSKVYLNIKENFTNGSWLCERGILAATNNGVEEINLEIQKLIPGLERSYKFIDSVLNIDDTVQYPAEFLSFSRAAIA